MRSKSIVIADDHPILLKGLNDELMSNDFKVVAAEVDGLAALGKIVSLKPDLAILDIQMPLMTGFEVIQKCKEIGLKTKFLILTSHKEKGIIYQARQLGVDGYLLKDEPFQEIVKAIHAINNGMNYFSLGFEAVYDVEINPELSRIKLLSNSEKMIVKAISEDKTNKQIAEEIGVSIRTIEKHRSNIIAKLELSSGATDLKDWAMANGQLLG